LYEHLILGFDTDHTKEALATGHGSR